MSPLMRYTRIVIALFFFAGLAIGITVGVNLQDPVEDSDLNPGRASNCEAQIAQNIDVLDDESLLGFGVEEVDAFGTLSPACMRPGVVGLIDGVKIAVLEETRQRALRVVRTAAKD
jgi:hypothetical protein